MGAEALVRWIHPKYGFMSPGDFIPLFEKNQFISRLDLYVWEETCRLMRQWIDAGLKVVPVSVNVSRIDIYQLDLCQQFRALTEKYHIDHRLLHLEITESAYTDNPQQIIKVVSQLRSEGFVIEMDDFGTGYSSLNMLSDLPIDVIKLDIQFIQNEHKKDGSRSILSFVISLAKWLGLQLITEGVETAEQVAQLRALKCYCVQGYYFHRPMPAKDFSELLQQNALLLKQVDETALESSSDVIITSQSPSNRVMLVVDDIELHRTILKSLFASSFTIVEANNGEAALHYVEEHPKDVAIILLDLIMPGMSGLEFLRKLKSNPFLSGIPVVTSSQSGPEEEIKALAAGASDCITKPYIPPIVLHRVECAIAFSNLRRESNCLERKKALLEEVYLDALTGLYNRRGLQKAVDDLFQAEPDSYHALYLFDLDNFKHCNDTMGHPYGDQLLTSFCEVLKSCTRHQDILARFGGDEFLLVLRNISDSVLAQKKGQQICDMLRNRSVSLDLPDFTCSAGVTLLQSSDGLDAAITRADHALYTAKDQGKSQCCWLPPPQVNP